MHGHHVHGAHVTSRLYDQHFKTAKHERTVHHAGTNFGSEGATVLLAGLQCGALRHDPDRPHECA